MITYKEKDEVVSYLLATGETLVQLRCEDVFPEGNVSKGEFRLILDQFVEKKLLSKSKGVGSGLFQVELTANMHDLFLHGGFKATEELLKANLEKLSYELEELSKLDDPRLINWADKITGIAASISTVLGLFSK